jgi:hydroxymethylbilane synthase
MKDVPGETPDELMFAAILPREDMRDVLVSRDNIKMESMPKGAKIGTGSQRRGAQIKAILPDINIVPLRGNIDTRLKKIETENLTGVILAAAGMKRMGLAERITQFLPVETMLPAVGQGALGLQIRKMDIDLIKICASLNDTTTATEVTAERSFLRSLGGGCRLPIAALGKLEGQRLSLEGMIAAPDGSTMIREKVNGSREDAEELGETLANIILEKGGKKLLDLIF